VTKITKTRWSSRSSRRLIWWAGTGLALAGLALSLGACRQEGTAERAGKQIDQTIGAAKDSASEAAEKARKAAVEAIEDARKAAAEAAQKAKDVAAGVAETAKDVATDAAEKAEEAKEKMNEKM
jgi:hypothetical protein